MVLCAASAYEQKFYINPEFDALPEPIQEELKVMCVLYTAEVGGVLTLEYAPDGELLLQVHAEEEDLLFDDIGSALKIKQIQREKQELLEALELYYKVFFLKQEPEAELRE